MRGIVQREVQAPGGDLATVRTWRLRVLVMPLAYGLIVAERRPARGASR